MHWINDWLWKIKGVVPPFCVEIILSDGTRYYLYSVLDHDEDTGTGVLRIYDLRALTEGEQEGLKQRLNNIKDRSELIDPEQLHPKLDWANVYLRSGDIIRCVEWHDRLWPENQPGFSSALSKNE